MLTVITGGSGSGKSAYAEDTILSYGEGERIYIATMFPFDEESHRRIARHRDMRKDKGFRTIECYTGLDKVKVPVGAYVLLECMSNLVANEMYQEGGAKERTVEAVMNGIRWMQEQAARLCVVTNETFSDCQPYDTETRRYQKYLGTINCQMVQMAQSAVEVVYGIPLRLK
ncbi:MAG: bifunctional adenosylcobinamide kinase/adenosylcobinamide-phosphate guanylyltransferase [Lachnospiraceae bacterium]|nr:bifunctional adenosylcobinamide kinase/adenosylcobinamide-phosphate guanylyltransferase [Lachnospiraceae bacterium]